MKKQLLSTIALLLIGFSGAMAQNGEILYTDYEPDLEVVGNDESLYIDMNGDNVYDIRIYTTDSSVGPWYYMEVVNDGWGYFCLNPSYNIIPDTTSFNTLTTWETQNCWNVDGGDKFAVRHVVGNDVYYGWFRSYWSWTYLPTNAPIAHMHLDKYAFCTVPNFDLHYGQLELDAVDETADASLVSVRPNPSKGMVSISGSDLNKIEVMNIAGEIIITSTCNSDEITVDISNQPAGVYIFSIIDRNGKVRAEKVIKE